MLTIRIAATFMMPLLLASVEPDRLTDLIDSVQRMKLVGDYAAIGQLVPQLLDELAKPSSNQRADRAAIGWNSVGMCYHVQGSYEEAERAYRRGIRLLDKPGSSSDMLAILLMNLAGLYLNSGVRPAQAEVLGRRGLQMATALHGPDSPALAGFFITLGAARYQQGDRKAARRYFEQAIAGADESPAGKHCQFTALGHLALLLAEDKQWVSARDSMLRSIGLIERSLGHSHLDLIRPALNLARVYEELKQWNLAKASVERARAIAEMQLPPQHNIMAEILWTCASIAKKTGHRREAQDLSRRARAIAAAQPKDTGAWVHAADLVRPVRDDFPRRLLGLDRPASSVAR